MKLRCALVAAIAGAGACARELPPQGQFVLYVDTDAIVRERAGTSPDPLALSPMVDRARFEVLQGGKPVPNSTRDVAIDAAMLRERRLSFGVVPPPGDTAVSVRVRLFRADRVLSSEPDPGVALDTTVTLPAPPADGVVELSVFLRTDDFGAPKGPIPAAPGPPASSRVGTWRGGKRVGCPTGARPGEACVPGASFFFGNPQFRGRAPTNDIFEERLVFVSAFFLDVHEVTVDAFRARWPDLQGRVPEPKANADDPYCTWSRTPLGDADQRALDCVSWSTARAYCEALGKTLPSEAQMELVGSGVGEEWAFPWGNDEPSCDAAVWGCGGIPGAVDDGIRNGADECRESRIGAGPFPPGQGRLDRVSASVLRSAGGDDIVDVGGNLNEWALDVWARPTDPFWSAVTPIADPVNTTPNALDGPDMRPVRGGDWASTALTTRAGFRRFRHDADVTPLIGFRCARPAAGP